MKYIPYILVAVAVLAFGLLIASNAAYSRLNEQLRRDVEIYTTQLEQQRELHNDIIHTIERLTTTDKAIRHEITNAIEANPEWASCPIPDDIRRVCNDILSTDGSAALGVSYEALPLPRPETPRD
jgi:hypothetical protein